jgi:cytochrome c-type biogenesis protein CcsB
VTLSIHPDFAHVSDALFTTAIATYTIAMASFTAEFAFGRKGKVAQTAVTAAPVQSRALVGAGVGSGGASIAGVDSELTDLDGGSAADDVAAGSAAAVSTDVDEPSPSKSARRSDRFGRIAIGITILGALFHLTSVTMRAVAVDRVPWGNMYEFASVAGLVAVVAFLVTVIKMPQIRYLGGFALAPVVVVLFLAGTVWYVQASPLVPALQSYWLAIHVSAAASSEGVFMTSSVLTALYLVRARYDRKVARLAAVASAGGPVSAPRDSWASRLPAAASLDKAAYRAAAFAFPIYTFGVICGAIWAEAAWGRYWGWDPKEVWAFIVWVLFAAYLHARATAGWRGRAAAWINLLGFAAMSFNFFVVNVVIAGLHSYSGLNS